MVKAREVKRSQPVIQVSPMGGLGNRMIQYMAARALAARVPDSRVVQIHLPEWGVQVAPVPPDGQEVLVVTEPHLNLDRLALLLNTGRIGRVDIRSYAQRMENFSSRDAYADLFGGPPAFRTAPDELLINIRQGDILDGHHPDYVLVPPEFYAWLALRTGLSPVFLGQIEDLPYLSALRERFPKARFVPSQGAIADFATLRAARHIVPAVSTFSWLAAWLSDSEHVHLPVLGLLHPLQSPATHLLPMDDARYSFHVFPHHYAEPVDRVAAAHAALRGLWREVPAHKLAAMLGSVPPRQSLADYLAVFDEGFYLGAHPDIAGAVRDGHMPSGHHHYEHHGFAEGRQGFALDRAWYCRTYPIAAVELGQGDAADAADHYVAIGRARGYRRAPDS